MLRKWTATQGKRFGSGGQRTDSPALGFFPSKGGSFAALSSSDTAYLRGEAAATAGEPRVSGGLPQGRDGTHFSPPAADVAPFSAASASASAAICTTKQALVRMQIRLSWQAERQAYLGAVLRLLIVIVDQKHRHHQVEHDELRQDQVAAATTAVERVPRGTRKAEGCAYDAK